MRVGDMSASRAGADDVRQSRPTSPQWKRVFGWTLCGLGGLAALLGVWAIGGYVWGVLQVLDEADQSWTFWGLIFVFIGFGALGVAAALILAGRSLLSRG
jgi:hypothetical protein